MLKGRTAFVTGSSRGIGWAIAEMFAAQGANLILNGRSAQGLLEERVAFLKAKYSVECYAVFGDVSEKGVVERFYQEIFKTSGKLDVIVNNAGILSDGLLGMLSEQLMQEVFAINTIAVARSIQGAARLMSRSPQGGSIINISSIIGTHGNAGQVIYGGSKAAVIGMTQSAAKELAPKNIRVNAIAPGFIETDMVRKLPAEKYQERSQSILMKRVGTPEDVAKVALFLASDLSSYVTGQVIGVDGGMII